MESDEQLARQLQAQLNAESRHDVQAQQPHCRGTDLGHVLFSQRHPDGGKVGRRGHGGTHGHRLGRH